MSTFFKQLEALGFQHLTIDFKKDSVGNVTIFITPKSMAADSALKELKPLFLTGNPDDIDAVFFDKIKEPMAKMREIFDNVSAFEAQQEEVNKNTAAAKDAKDKVSKAEESLKKLVEKYKDDAEWVKNKDAVTKALGKVFEIDFENTYAARIKKDLETKIAAASQVGMFEEGAQPAAATATKTKKADAKPADAAPVEEKIEAPVEPVAETQPVADSGYKPDAPEVPYREDTAQPVFTHEQQTPTTDVAGNVVDELPVDASGQTSIPVETVPPAPVEQPLQPEPVAVEQPVVAEQPVQEQIVPTPEAAPVVAEQPQVPAAEIPVASQPQAAPIVPPPPPAPVAAEPSAMFDAVPAPSASEQIPVPAAPPVPTAPEPIAVMEVIREEAPVETVQPEVAAAVDVTYQLENPTPAADFIPPVPVAPVPPPPPAPAAVDSIEALVNSELTEEDDDDLDYDDVHHEDHE